MTVKELKEELSHLVENNRGDYNVLFHSDRNKMEEVERVLIDEDFIELQRL